MLFLKDVRLPPCRPAIASYVLTFSKGCAEAQVEGNDS